MQSQRRYGLFIVRPYIQDRLKFIFSAWPVKRSVRYLEINSRRMQALTVNKLLHHIFNVTVSRKIECNLSIVCIFVRSTRLYVKMQRDLFVTSCCGMKRDHTKRSQSGLGLRERDVFFSYVRCEGISVSRSNEESKIALPRNFKHASNASSHGSSVVRGSGTRCSNGFSSTGFLSLSSILFDSVYA